MFLFLTVVIAFLSLVASSDCRTPNLGNQKADAEPTIENARLDIE